MVDPDYALVNTLALRLLMQGLPALHHEGCSSDRWPPYDLNGDELDYLSADLLTPEDQVDTSSSVRRGQLIRLVADVRRRRVRVRYPR